MGKLKKGGDEYLLFASCKMEIFSLSNCDGPLGKVFLFNERNFTPCL